MIYIRGYADGFANASDGISVEYIYHMHKDGDGNEYDDGAVIYSTTDPGGCFVANGHTHNKTGTCPTTTSTTTHTLILMEISNEGTSADQGHY